MVFAGTMSNVKVKYEKDQAIFRTPVSMTSNVDIFPKVEAFKTRIIKYLWPFMS